MLIHGVATWREYPWGPQVHVIGDAASYLQNFTHRVHCVLRWALRLLGCGHVARNNCPAAHVQKYVGAEEVQVASFQMWCKQTIWQRFGA